MFKRILCVLLTAVVLLSCLSVGGVSAASDSTVTVLSELADKFPHGKYWNHRDSGKNNPDGVTDVPCAGHSNCHWAANSCDCNSFDNAIQCMGYAHKIAYEIVGKSPRSAFTKYTTLKASNLRVGDIIRYRWNGHSLCVTGVSGNKISFTDCNWIGRCQIRWGVMDISDIMGFSYVLHYEGNNRKNTDLDFYKTTQDETPDISETDAHEIWGMYEGNLNIRASRTTSAQVIGQIPNDTEFRIYDKYDDGTYLWGKVLYGDVMGWCALNYSEYLSGSIEKPTITNVRTAYMPSEEIDFTFKQVGGSGHYRLYIYDSNGDVYGKYTVSASKRTKTVTVDEEGEYTARVYALNSLTPSWKIASKDFSFKVVAKSDFVKVKSIKITASSKLAKGDTLTAEATVKPADATDSGVIWTSSDTSIASVNSKGTVTAKKYGKVTITCTDANSGKVKAEKSITVVPSKVKNIKQTYSSASSVKLSWSKVSGATQYAVYKYDSTTGEYEKLSTVSTNACTIKASAGKKYKIKVYAVAKVGSKSYSSVASEAFTAVSGPKMSTLKAAAGEESIKLTWSKTSGATHYVIYSVSGSKSTKVATVESDKLAYTVKNLKSGKTYEYKVRALQKSGDVNGYGTYSNTVSVKVK